MSSGYAALALAALIGAASPGLNAPARQRLAQVMEGETVPGPALTVTAKAVTCHAGNVDITAYGCALEFGAKTVQLSGAAANALFATMLENGVPADGAAGSVYVSLRALCCTIAPTDIAQKNGGGAACRFTAGP